MNKLALGVEVVERKENLHQARLKEGLGKAMSRITVKKIPKAVPHGLLNQAVMVTSWAANGECVQGRSHMGIAGMGRIGLAQMLINLKLSLTHSLARIHFQSHISMRSNSISDVG